MLTEINHIQKDKENIFFLYTWELKFNKTKKKEMSVSILLQILYIVGFRRQSKKFDGILQFCLQ